MKPNFWAFGSILIQIITLTWYLQVKKNHWLPLRWNMEGRILNYCFWALTTEKISDKNSRISVEYNFFEGTRNYLRRISRLESSYKTWKNHANLPVFKKEEDLESQIERLKRGPQGQNHDQWAQVWIAVLISSKKIHSR